MASTMRNSNSRAILSCATILILISLALQFLHTGANVTPIGQSAENCHLSGRSLMEDRSEEFAVHARSSRKVARSRSRRHRLGAPGVFFQSDNFEEYLLRFSIGTPPREFVGVLDTGSDVVWVQCDPCKECLAQDAVFETSTSSSYESISCQSSQCTYLNETSDTSCGTTGACQYNLTYGTGSTVGDLSSDVLTLASDQGQNKTFPDFLFGCSHEVATGAEPILGLSRSNLSLVKQLGPEVGNAFSFCFAAWSSNKTTEFTLGSSDTKNLMYTPMLELDTPSELSFYFVNLTGISVDGALLPISPEVFIFQLYASGYKGVILDTGTSISTWADEAYYPLRSAVASAIPYPTGDASATEYDLCYNVTELNATSLDQLHLPAITLHFQDLDLQLPSSNAYDFAPQPDTNVITLLCLAMNHGGPIAEPGNSNVFGNYQMQNHYFFFDLDSGRVGVKPKQC